MTNRLATFAAAALLSLSAAVLAQPPGSIHERIDRMESRIERGIRSGDLTRQEADRLRGELREIKHRERRMRDDGRLDHRERDRLNADLDRLSRHIEREKRDDDRRGQHRPYR